METCLNMIRMFSSVGDIFTKLIQHVEVNSKTEPEGFAEISRALRAQVRRLKVCLPTEHPDKSESGTHTLWQGGQVY